MEESKWHFVSRLPAPADGSSAELMSWLLRFDGGGGGFSYLALGVGIDYWTVFSILRDGGGCVGAMLGISSYDTYGVSTFRTMFPERISSLSDALVKVLVAG